MMNRVLFTSATLAALAACSGNDAQTGANGNEETADVLKVDPAMLISGTVTVPEGQSLDGAKAMACLTPQETCAQNAEVPVTIENGVGRYEIVVPQKGDYHVMIWKDVNGNATPDGGDLMAFANNMEAFPSGERLTPMTLFVRAAGHAKMTTNPGGFPYRLKDPKAAAEAVKTAGIAGNWSQQSFGTELVWGPEIKFQAAGATAGFGTDLGGTFGAGSATNSTIVYSYKPVQVKRSMALDVAPDGTFHMTANMERRQGDCTPVRQEKFGYIRMEGGKMIFAVADARQTCGKGKAEKMKAEDETYTFSRKGNGFHLAGENGIDWTFTKR